MVAILSKFGWVVKPAVTWWQSRKKATGSLFPIEAIPARVQEALRGPWKGRVRMMVPLEKWPDEFDVMYHLEPQAMSVSGKAYFPGGDGSQRTSEMLGGVQNGHVLRLDYKLITPQLSDFGYGEVMLHLTEKKDHLIGSCQGYVSETASVYSGHLVLCRGTSSPCAAKSCPYRLGGDPLAATGDPLPGLMPRSLPNQAIKPLPPDNGVQAAAT